MSGRYSRRAFLKLGGQGGAMVTGSALIAGLGLTAVAGTVTVLPQVVAGTLPGIPKTEPRSSAPALSPPQELPKDVPEGQSPDGRTGKELDTPYQKDGIIIVSKNHWVSREFQPLPKSAVDRGLVEPAKTAYDQMIAAAKAANITLVLRSGYRDYDFQQVLYRRSLNEEGEKSTEEYLAKPGQSEHQTGLVADIYDGKTWGTEFAKTAAYKWLQENSYKFGFVCRYLQTKEEITGYLFEPWHYRWIGVPHATQFGPNTNLTIEEYLGIH